VKTSQQDRFVTSITQKYLANDTGAPDFWVLVQIEPNEDGTFNEQFFVLTHQEIWHVQNARNEAYLKKYIAKHGKQFDLSKGVDNVTVADVKQYKDQWSKIVDRLGGPASG